MTKETGTTQPALPEQCLIHPNLIIAPTFTLSHKSTAAGDGSGSRLLCAMGNNTHGSLSWPCSDLWKIFHHHRLGVPDNLYNLHSVLLSFFLSFFLSVFPSFPVSSRSVVSMCGLHRDAFGCLCFNTQRFMSGCWKSVRAGRAQMSLF